MISIIRIVAVVFGIFALSRAFLRFRGKEIGISEFFFWSVTWLLLLLLAVFPQYTPIVSKQLGIERGVDVFVYGGVMLLFYLVFRIYVRLEKMDQGITRLVQEIAKKK